MNEHLEALFSFRKNAPDSVIDLEKNISNGKYSELH